MNKTAHEHPGFLYDRVPALEASAKNVKAAIHKLALAILDCNINQHSKARALRALDALESSPECSVTHKQHRLVNGGYLVTAEEEITAAPVAQPTPPEDTLDALGNSLRNEEWRIKITGDTFRFTRYVDGQLNESYRNVQCAEAAVWAAAVIQGYEPPRALIQSDRPA